MAEEGILLTDFYAAQAVCSASRAALLTGCYPNRLGVHGAYMPNSKKGLNPSETTLAEMLKDVNYKTAIYGKWHLGGADKFHPLNRGFDEFYGFRGGARSYFAYEEGKEPSKLELMERNFAQFEEYANEEIMNGGPII